MRMHQYSKCLMGPQLFLPMEIASIMLLATASAVLLCTLVRCCCRHFLMPMPSSSTARSRSTSRRSFRTPPTTRRTGQRVKRPRRRGNDGEQHDDRFLGRGGDDDATGVVGQARRGELARDGGGRGG